MFATLVRQAALTALPGIQTVYDRWNSPRPGMGLCGSIAYKVEQSLAAFGVESELIGENGHLYVLAVSPSGEAIAVDIPWRLYESPQNDPTIDPFTNWSKLPGITFGADSFEFTTIV